MPSLSHFLTLPFMYLLKSDQKIGNGNMEDQNLSGLHALNSHHTSALHIS